MVAPTRAGQPAGKAQALEAWNEPNLWMFLYPQRTPDDPYFAARTYLRMLKAFHAGGRNYTKDQLQEQYDLLMMRIARQLQDKDLALHGQLCNAWEPLWAQLQDRGRFMEKFS